MLSTHPNWRENVFHFLAENLPTALDRPGWEHKSSTAYQIGCMALVKLGFADETEWGAAPRRTPVLPTITPRWDDICISVLWLAEQSRSLSFCLPDGSLSQPTFGYGFEEAKQAPPLFSSPDIKACFGLGCAKCDQDVLRLLELLGLVSEGSWTWKAVFILWRTMPALWSLDFSKDKRFLEAVRKATETIPDDIAAEISDLIDINDEQLNELIALHEINITEMREKCGPKARLGEVPTKERARRSLEASHRAKLNWIFFRRWRIDDGWLSKREAEEALEIFHDRLAISMRKSVVRRLHPSKPQFSE